MKPIRNILLLAGLLFLAACSAQVTQVANPTDVIASPAPTNTTAPTQMEPTPTQGQIPVDLTPAQLAAIQAISAKYGVPADQVKLVSTEAVTWSNGCLDIVLPGVMCTQALVDGFRIIMEANGQQYEFHTNQDGSSVIDAAQLQATLGFVVSKADHTIQVVNPNIPLGPTYNPAFNGLLPYGGSIQGNAYVLDFSQGPKAVSVNANGVQELSFIQKPNYGLAIWRAGQDVQPRLAWGTQSSDPSTPSTLLMSNLDGTQLETLLTQEAGTTPPTQLVAEAWSADGQTLYFSKEPVGLGGYILFNGASNLYKIDITTKQVSELIPEGSASSPVTCLDALSGDYRYVADHCTQGVITIRDLTSGGTSTVLPPDGSSGFQVMGSARFSPDGSRVAFALAKNNPDNEQGWVAVSDGLNGGSKLVLSGPEGAYYTVAGWLDDQTLLVQLTLINCTSNCENQVWTVNVDGTNPVQVAEGSLLTVIDNR